MALDDPWGLEYNYGESHIRLQNVQTFCKHGDSGLERHMADPGLILCTLQSILTSFWSDY